MTMNTNEQLVNKSLTFGGQFDIFWFPEGQWVYPGWGSALCPYATSQHCSFSWPKLVFSSFLKLYIFVIGKENTIYNVCVHLDKPS